MVKFTPNLCDNKDAKIKCSVCKKSAEAPGLLFFTKTLLPFEWTIKK